MNRQTQIQQLLEKQVAAVVRKNFLAEVAALREAGRDLPDDQEVEKHFTICFESDDPAQDIERLLGCYRRRPMRSATRAQTSTASRSDRTSAHEALGIQFSADDIDAGLVIGKALDRLAGR